MKHIIVCLLLASSSMIYGLTVNDIKKKIQTAVASANKINYAPTAFIAWQKDAYAQLAALHQKSAPSAMNITGSLNNATKKQLAQLLTKVQQGQLAVDALASLAGGLADTLKLIRGMSWLSATDVVAAQQKLMSAIDAKMADSKQAAAQQKKVIEQAEAEQKKQERAVEKQRTTEQLVQKEAQKQEALALTDIKERVEKVTQEDITDVQDVAKEEEKIATAETKSKAQEIEDFFDSQRHSMIVTEEQREQEIAEALKLQELFAQGEEKAAALRKTVEETIRNGEDAYLKKGLVEINPLLTKIAGASEEEKITNAAQFMSALHQFGTTMSKQIASMTVEFDATHGLTIADAYGIQAYTMLLEQSYEKYMLLADSIKSDEIKNAFIQQGVDGYAGLYAELQSLMYQAITKVCDDVGVIIMAQLIHNVATGPDDTAALADILSTTKKFDYAYVVSHSAFVQNSVIGGLIEIITSLFSGYVPSDAYLVKGLSSKEKKDRANSIISAKKTMQDCLQKKILAVYQQEMLDPIAHRVSSLLKKGNERTYLDDLRSWLQDSIFSYNAFVQFINTTNLLDKPVAQYTQLMFIPKLKTEQLNLLLAENPKERDDVLKKMIKIVDEWITNIQVGVKNLKFPTQQDALFKTDPVFTYQRLFDQKNDAIELFKSMPDTDINKAITQIVSRIETALATLQYDVVRIYFKQLPVVIKKWAIDQIDMGDGRMVPLFKNNNDISTTVLDKSVLMFSKIITSFIELLSENALLDQQPNDKPAHYVTVKNYVQSVMDTINAQYLTVMLRYYTNQKDKTDQAAIDIRFSYNAAVIAYNDLVARLKKWQLLDEDYQTVAIIS